MNNDCHPSNSDITWSPPASSKVEKRSFYANQRSAQHIPTVTSMDAIGDLDNRMSLTKHARRRRSASDPLHERRQSRPCCLMPLLAMYFLLTAVVVLGTTSIVVTSYTSSLESSLHRFIETYGRETSDRVVFYVLKHWAKIRQAAVAAERVCNQRNLMPNVSDPTELLHWFGRQAYDIDVRFGYYHTEIINGTYFGTVGIGFHTYSLIQPSTFPKRPPYLVVETHNGTTQRWASAYYNMTTWSPIAPLYDSVVPFFACSTPWGAACNRSLFWTLPYVSFITSSSVVAIAGKCSFYSAKENRMRTGVFIFGDFTQDIVAYFRALEVSATGVALLVDAASRAFVGGNIGDRITITTPGNGTAASRTRLAKLEDLTDPRVHVVVQASNATGSDVLMRCPTPCSFIHRAGDTELSETMSGGLWLFRDFEIVRVAAVRDGHGINMRLIAVLPASDFTAELRNASIRGVIIASCVLGGLLLLVTATLHFLLRPLHTIEKILQALASTTSSAPGYSLQNNRSATGHVTSMFGGPRRTIIAPSALVAFARGTSFKEVSKLSVAIVRLVSELEILASYLPPQVSRALLHVVGTRGSRVRAQEQDDDHTSSVLSPRVSLQTVSTGLEWHEDDAHLLHPSRDVAASSVVMTVATIVAGDVQNFHGAIRAIVPLDVPVLHKVIIDVVQLAVQASGGTLAFFYGDHVFAHFNAAQRLKGHAAAACRAVLQVTETLVGALPADIRDALRSARGGQGEGGTSAPLASLLRMHFGISTGQCVCGVTSHSTSTFHVLGACVSQAVGLCSTLRSETCSRHLVAVHTVRLLRRSEFVVKHAKVVVLRQETSKTCASIVLRSVDVSAERARDIALHNEAFEQSAEGVA